MIYRFNSEYIIDLEQNEISHENESFKVPEKYMRVLELLIHNSAELVSREQLFAEVWNGTIVVEEALTQAISELRKYFKDSAKDSKVIKTIPKKGYVLIANVEKVEYLDEDKIPTIQLKRKRNIKLALALSLPLTLLLFIFFQPKVNELSILRGPIPATAFTGSEMAPVLFSDPDKLLFLSKGNQKLKDGLYLKSFSDETHLALVNHLVRNVKLNADESQFSFIDSNRIYLQSFLSADAKEIYRSKYKIEDYILTRTNELILVQEDSKVNYTLLSSNGKVLKSFKSSAKPMLVLNKENDEYILIHFSKQTSFLDLYKNSELLEEKSLENKQIKALQFKEGRNLLIAEKNRLYSYEFNSANLEELFFIPHMISSFSYSSRNHMLAFDEQNESRDIYEKKGANYVKRISSAMLDFNPKEAFHSKSLAFVSTRCGNENLWLSLNDSSISTPLTKFTDGQIIDFHWAKNEAALYFLRREKAKQNLYKVNINQRNFELLTDSNNEVDFERVADSLQLNTSSDTMRFIEKQTELFSNIYLIQFAKP